MGSLFAACYDFFIVLFLVTKQTSWPVLQMISDVLTYLLTVYGCSVAAKATVYKELRRLSHPSSVCFLTEHGMEYHIVGHLHTV